MPRVVCGGTGSVLALLASAGTLAAQTPSPVGDTRAPSFLNDVTPLLTRLGANQGACHGKGAGQNGFRLSLRGYAPELDHPWITREFTGRRIDTSVPENSLLLLKPLAVAPHEGGKVLLAGSREYDHLLGWLRAGAPGPDKNDPAIARLELLPRNRTLRVRPERPLSARGEFSDGSWHDVTWLTKFESNDAGVVAVSPAGLVKAQRQGETAIRASFLGQVAIVIVTVPFDQPVPAERFAVKNNFIDE